MDLYHFLLCLALFYAVVLIYAYKDEIKEKEAIIKCRDRQMEDLRTILNSYIKEEKK